MYLNVFDNINEFTKYLVTKPHKEGRHHGSDEKGSYALDFTGTHDLEEALDLIKYGDEKLYKKIKDKKAAINVDKILGNAKRRPEYKHDVCGFVPNVPAFLIGNPRNMLDIKKNKTSSRILNIFLNIRVGGGISSDFVLEMGTKYLVVLDALEKMGYRCNLYSGVANEDDGNYSCLMVRIKTDKEPLNLKKICFTIAHPSMQRRLKFKWMEVNDGDHNFTYGYGGHASESTIKKFIDTELRDNFMIWNYEDFSSSSTIEDILKKLEEKGIKIKEED